MKLADLKTALDSAKSEVDIGQVYFDFMIFMNTQRGKQYPLIVWDITNLRGLQKSLETDEIPDIFQLDVYAIGLVTPESDLADLRLGEWDELEEDLQQYLLQVNGLTSVQVQNKNLITEFEYYPAGFFSVDRELGVRYNVTLKLWC